MIKQPGGQRGKHIAVIRNHLGEILCDGFHATSYIEFLDENRKRRIHSVSTHDTPNKCKFNCIAYALGIFSLDGYLSIEGLKLNTARPAFLEYIARKELVPSKNVSEGDIVSYKNGDTVKHAGIVQKWERRRRVIISKWGGNLIHTHGLWEVPPSYGAVVEFYAAPSPTDALEWLHAWRKNM